MTTAVGAPILCYLCDKPADGTRHDLYGEFMMRRTDLVVCKKCDDALEDEPGPWSEW